MQAVFICARPPDRSRNVARSSKRAFQRSVVSHHWVKNLIAHRLPPESQAAASSNGAEDIGGSVLALLRVQRGIVVSDILTRTTAEQRFALALFDWVEGLSFLDVSQACSVVNLAPAIPLVRYGHGGHSSLFRLAQVCEEGLRASTYHTCTGSRTGNEILRSWGLEAGSIMCIVAPASLARLIAVGAWASIPWHPSWRAEAYLFPEMTPWPAELKSRKRHRPLFQVGTHSVATFHDIHNVADTLVEHWPDIEAAALRRDGDLPGDEVAQARVEVCSQVATLRCLAESCALDTSNDTSTFSAAMVVHCLLMASQLRDAQALHRSLQFALRIVAPKLAEQWTSLLEVAKLPSKSTMSRWALRLDVVHMHLVKERYRDGLVRASQMDLNEVATRIEEFGSWRTASADASPIRRREVFLVESRVHSLSEMLECCQRMKSTAAVLASGTTAERRDDLWEWHRQMSRCSTKHVHPPVFLGARSAGLTQKLRATLHSLSLEVDGLQGLLGWTATLGAWCSVYKS